MSAIAKVQDNFRVFSDRPCLVGADGRTLSYGEVEALAVAAERRFAQAGLKPGDVVALLATNSLELAILLLGAWTAGCVVAPINPDLSKPQIESILGNARPGLIIATEAIARRLEAAGLEAGAPFFIVEEQSRQLGAATAEDKAADSSSAIARVFQHLEQTQPLMVIYTAGSTGKPKGVQIAPGPLFGNEQLFCAELGIDETNRFYNILPMSYLGGVHNLLLLPMSVGASVVIDVPLGASNLFGFWRRVRDLKVDTLWLTGAMLSMLLKNPAREDESWIPGQIRLGLVGMAPLQPGVRERFESRFGFRLNQNYALSETLFLTSQRPGELTVQESSGRLLPGISVTVCDPQGRPVAAGSEGELYVRTPYMMKGYRDASPEDNAALSDGVFRSGDLGYFDEHGELHISGRVKDLIIRGGLNISPSLVESVLAGHSSVFEVAVVGVPDPVYGEEVVAVIVPQASDAPGADTRSLSEALGAFAAQQLPMFQRPKKVFIWPSLPRNHANKIDKPAIRRQLSEQMPAGRA